MGSTATLLLRCLLVAVCIVFYRKSSFAGTSRCSDAVRVKKAIVTKASSNGVIIRKPFHDFPSFDVSGMVGTVLPYAKIDCGKEFVKPGHKIPNLVHYVWFGVFKISLVQYYAIRSAALIQRPKLIIFHMDHDQPVGLYWERLKSEIPCIRIEHIEAPEKIFDRKISLVEHKSDVARIDILLKYGGMYSDVNVIFVRPMDDLMGYSTVLGKEEDRSYGNSFILSERNSTFVQVWQKSYINFDHTHWSDHSTVMPKTIHNLFPEIPLHVEQYSMMRPNYIDGPRWLTHRNWDLRYSYCVHLYVNDRNAKNIITTLLNLPESDLVTMDNTFGQVIRLSLFGTPYLKVDELDEKLLKAHSVESCGSGVTDDGISNVIHYVWNGEEIQYHHYLSMRASVQVMQPRAVYFHKLLKADPFHYPYLLMLREIACIQLVDSSGQGKLNFNASLTTSENKLLHGLHILKEFGGVLLDFNSTLIQPISDWFHRDFVIGRTKNAFEFSMILAKKHSPLVLQWIELVDNGLDSQTSLTSLLKITEQNILVLENAVFVPNSTWFSLKNADLPFARAISLRKSGLDLEKEDVNEKDVLKKENFFGIFAKIVLFGSP